MERGYFLYISGVSGGDDMSRLFLEKLQFHIIAGERGGPKGMIQTMKP